MENLLFSEPNESKWYIYLRVCHPVYVLYSNSPLPNHNSCFAVQWRTSLDLPSLPSMTTLMPGSLSLMKGEMPCDGSPSLASSRFFAQIFPWTIFSSSCKPFTCWLITARTLLLISTVVPVQEFSSFFLSPFKHHACTCTEWNKIIWC